eukprot:jgi/Galph1/5929/GphlegSOOS_G4573.1
MNQSVAATLSIGRLPSLASLFKGPNAKRKTAVTGALVLAAIAVEEWWRKKQSRKAALQTLTPSERRRQRRDRKVRVDKVFLNNLWYFLRIIFPSVRSKEFGTVLLVGMLLVARSYLDIWVSDNGGDVVKAIVGRNLKRFIRKAVLNILLMSIPISLVNNLLKYTISELQMLMRRRLTLYFHEEYLSYQTYYKVCNLDSRIQNVDQLLSQDVDKFTNSLATLYSNVAKPLLDIVLFSNRLARTLGSSGPLIMIAYFLITSAILRAIQPPFGRLTADEQKLEGEYRLRHSRLITHSEEIAFYGGGNREKIYINESFTKVIRHLRKILRLRLYIGVIDSFLVKYLATIVGYCIVSVPIFLSRIQGPANPQNSEFSSSYLTNGTDLEEEDRLMRTGGAKEHIIKGQEDIAALYTRNSRLLMALSSAIGRIVMAGKELPRISGYCARVTELEQVLYEVSKSHESNGNGAIKTPKGLTPVFSVSSSVDLFSSNSDLVSLKQQNNDELSSLCTPGEVIISDIIRFEHVNIISPDRTILCRDLNLEVPPGVNVLITGPNGCGKSSLFRVLAGLWPVYGKRLYRPESSKIFYVPQRPYLALGTLRDQIIYPLTKEEAEERGCTDELLKKLLHEVYLDDIGQRKGGLDAVCDWSDVLSGGEKQRIAMARLFFHQPVYAVLDECTSAVSLDVEGHLYTSAKNRQITLLTVSHRPSLWRFHEKILRFDGQGSYNFTDLDPSEIPPIHTSSYTQKTTRNEGPTSTLMTINSDDNSSNSTSSVPAQKALDETDLTSD